MAKTPAANSEFKPPQFSDADKRAAREWFKKAAALREQRNYDYAVEAYTSGLGFWPDSVEEGHKPLWSLAIQRQQAGGKKPGMLDGMKKPMSHKDPKQGMLNAAHLSAMDPGNGSYLDGYLKNAVKGGYLETVEFIAPKALDSLRKDKKPDTSRFTTFKQLMVDAAEMADQAKDKRTAVFLELAVNACEFQIGRAPTDMKLRDEQRELAGRLTIAKGNYSDAESFRDSLRDAEKAAVLHDSERVKQSDESLGNLVDSARREYAANPGVASKLYALVDALLKSETSEREDEAVELLSQAYRSSNNYSFKVKADDVRLRQLRRQSRRLKDLADQSRSEDDQQQYRLAVMEEQSARLDVARERAEKYPTDMRIKFQLGEVLFNTGQYDEAIPVLQAAQSEPRSRTRALMLIGRSFFEKEQYPSAIEVLKEALGGYEITGDETNKRLLEWLGEAHERGGQIAEAREIYSRLIRLDYNYGGGAIRKRLEAMK